MKTKKILALVLALVLIGAASLPAHAAEGEELPPDLPEQVETVPPEEIPEIPDENEEIPDGETPDGEENPDDKEIPGENPEIPDEEIPEIPDEEIPDEDEEIMSGEVPGEDEEAPGEKNGEEEPDPWEEVPAIDVLVPANGQVVVNPYRMSIATTYGETTEQIVHEAQFLENLSDFPVLVTARVTGTLQPWGEARFVDFPPAEDAVDKEIFMYAEFQPADFLWSYDYSDGFNQILVTDWGIEKENVLMLDAWGVGCFRLFGAMTDFPAVMWSAEDAPSVTLTFTFAPLETPEVLPEEEDILPEENGVSPEEDAAFPEETMEDIPEPWAVDIPEDIPADEDFPEDMEVNDDWQYA